MSDQQITIELNCEDGLNAGLLSVDQARTEIETIVSPVIGTEQVGLRESLGRFLAKDVISPINVPAHTNSAVDGYAVGSQDFPDGGICALSVIGTSWAGRPYGGAVNPGEAVRIMTGAVMPEGADSVIMQEHTERDGESIRIGEGHKSGQNVRAAGEDLAAGQVVFTSGRRINAADLGLLGSLGLGEVPVMRRLKVAFFSTGDELQSIGKVLEIGQIYDSNRYTLFGLLSRLGVEIIDMGVVRDTRKETEQAFAEGAASADVLITTGGVSVGEADYVTETLDKLGSTNFWKIAMKPGRPLAFGRIGDAIFFGLPGNPVAVMVTFLQFVRPALLKMAGASGSLDPLTLRVRCNKELRKRPGRTEFQRGILEQGDGGELTVSSVGAQGSGILRSMSDANCFIILESEQTTVEAGAEVLVQPFTDLL